MTDIYDEIARLRKERLPCAVATVVQATGSSPQRAGAKMLVLPGRKTLGTIGGGCVEARVKEEAQLALEDGIPRTIPFDLVETEGGLVCGGHMVVFVEPVLPDPELIVLGAGHVGQALAAIAGIAGFRVTVVDDREEYADPARFPPGTTVLARSFADPLRGIGAGAGSFIVVATRGHDHDLEAVAAALRTPAGYIGLVGSRRKRGVIASALGEAGCSRTDIERVIVPVGMPIGSVDPGEIAISIMAQIVSIRRNHGERAGNPARCGELAADGTTQAAPAAR